MSTVGAPGADAGGTNGGLVRENGDHFRETLLSRGGSTDAMQLFFDFAGREPRVEPLLEKRGLTAPAAD